MKEININDEQFLVHEAGIVTTTDLVPVEVYWEENPTKEFFKVAGEKIYTHSIVALAFFGKDAEGKIVRHKDNDLTNNQISNLELIDREQVGERVAKAHLIQHKETKEVMTIFNWHQFEDKDQYKILITFNDDKSISYSAKHPSSSFCKHVDCNEKKQGKQGHCRYHRNQLKITKDLWKKQYDALPHDGSDVHRNSLLELLDLTTGVCATYGVNMFLQLPDVYSIYDVPTASTLTRLSGEWDIAYTDELGTINSIIEQEYAGD